MSLINKMLQDLDKRGGAGDGVDHPQELKAVPPPERDRRPLLLAGAGVAAAVLAVGGWYGWQYWQGHRAPPAPAPRVIVDQVPPGARGLPPPAPAPQSALTETTAKPVAAPPTPEPTAKPLSAPAPEKAEPISSSTPPARRPGKSLPAPAESEQTAASRAPSRATDEPAAARPRRAAPDADARRAEQPEGVSRREQTPKLESDGAYRRALVALQEGRLSVALADLERALDIDPRNEAARQTYVSLLLENKRTDEAIRQLRLSLGIDPRQPGLAMVLARLQLERGGPALDTLMKTLPYAGDSADYLAFLAGVLQREQRHGEAARYYRDALQLAPNNGVWWMGLAISLQADQHPSEAREAFQRARQSNGLTPELQAFIERRLEQLSR